MIVISLWLVGLGIPPPPYFRSIFEALWSPFPSRPLLSFVYLPVAYTQEAGGVLATHPSMFFEIPFFSFLQSALFRTPLQV